MFDVGEGYGMTGPGAASIKGLYKTIKRHGKKSFKTIIDRFDLVTIDARGAQDGYSELTDKFRLCTTEYAKAQKAPLYKKQATVSWCLKQIEDDAPYVGTNSLVMRHRGSKKAYNKEI